MTDTSSSNVAYSASLTGRSSSAAKVALKRCKDDIYLASNMLLRGLYAEDEEVARKVGDKKHKQGVKRKLPSATVGSEAKGGKENTLKEGRENWVDIGEENLAKGGIGAGTLNSSSICTSAPSSSPSSDVVRWPSGRPVCIPPKKHVAGLRNPAFHGCGKCRHRPSGCKSCILYDQTYPFVPTTRKLPAGAVSKSFENVGQFSTPKSLPSGRGLTKLKPDAIWTTVVVGKSDLDVGNFGVFASVDIPEGAILIDETVDLVPRDSDYAKAHFNEYDYVAVGSALYILLREPEQGMCSLTFFTNEANHGGDVGQNAHIEWRMKGNSFIWKFIRSAKKAEELLVRYDRELTK